jgi:hypothetical protein
MRITVGETVETTPKHVTKHHVSASVAPKSYMVEQMSRPKVVEDCQFAIYWSRKVFLMADENQKNKSVCGAIGPRMNEMSRRHFVFFNLIFC